MTDTLYSKHITPSYGNSTIDLPNTQTYVDESPDLFNLSDDMISHVQSLIPYPYRREDRVSNILITPHLCKPLISS
jgi:hypothetical protein